MWDPAELLLHFLCARLNSSELLQLRDSSSSSSSARSASSLVLWLCGTMESEGAEPAAEPRSRHLFTWWDPESAAVVTILLGVFQVLLTAPLAYTDQSLPKLFILPLFLGILIIAGGSITMVNERNPSRLWLKGCICSNVLGLLVSLIALCLYCYALVNQKVEPCEPPVDTLPHYYYYSFTSCPSEQLADYTWSVTLLLVLYDSGAVIMHCLLSLFAFKKLHTA